MKSNTSVSLGSYFENFVKEKVQEGRYKNASEVIRIGLRLLEEEEQKLMALNKALKKGVDSGFITDFDPEEYLRNLKVR